MDTARGTIGGLPDIHMDTAKGYTIANDISMDTARGNTTLKVGPLKAWERELVENPEIRRKSTVAQLYFLDYYFQLLGYIASRQERRSKFDADTTS